MAIDETRKYLTSLFEPEYHRYIKTQLARDFAVTLSEKFRVSCNQAIATDALQCPECQQNGDSGMNFCANCGRQLWHR